MKKIILIFFIFCINVNVSEAAIKVSPATVEIDANKIKKDYLAGSFSVEGGKDETIRFKIYPEFFEHDKKGGYIKLPDKGQPNSLIDKVKFYPAEFTCKDGIPQKVRFTITDIKSLPPGESRLALFLEDTQTKEYLIQKASGQIGGRIIVKTRMGVPIYLNKGNYSRKGTLDAVAFKKSGDDYICEYKVSSLGNSRLYYSGFAYISQEGKLIKTIPVNPASVDPSKMLEKIQKLNIEKGDLEDGKEYDIKFVLTYNDENNKPKILKQEFKFTPLVSVQKSI